MEHQGLHYHFTAKIWKHNAAGGWHFVTLPKMYSTEIRENLKHEEEGWGRLKAKARVNNITWDTAIWFDSKEKTYLLPIKAAIRKTGKIVSGESLEVDIWI